MAHSSSSPNKESLSSKLARRMRQSDQQTPISQEKSTEGDDEILKHSNDEAESSESNSDESGEVADVEEEIITKETSRKSSKTERKEKVDVKSKNDDNDNDDDDCDDDDDDVDSGDESAIYVKNVMGKTYKIVFSDEVKDYVRDLCKQSEMGRPPTIGKIKMLNNEALRQLLKYNDRPFYKEQGRNQLAIMVLDYIKNGCPPRCPKCKRGALRFSNGKLRYGKRYYWCPGSTKDGKHFLNCTFKAEREEIERLPFRTPP